MKILKAGALNQDEDVVLYSELAEFLSRLGTEKFVGSDGSVLPCPSASLERGTSEMPDLDELAALSCVKE